MAARRTASRSTRTSSCTRTSTRCSRPAGAGRSAARSLDYEIDGVVVKINDYEVQQALGVVGREPRWSIAFKFAPTTAVTKLEKIGVNVGRTGNLIPWAIARARPGQRRDGQQGDAPQRGGPRAQGHPRGRPGRDHARGRRDPAGRLPDHPAAHRQGEALPAARRSARRAGRRPSSRRARSGPAARTATTARDRSLQALKHFVSQGRDGHRGLRREARLSASTRRGSCARCRTSTASRSSSSSSSRGSSASRPRTSSPRSSAPRSSRSTACCTRSASRASAT